MCDFNGPVDVSTHTMIAARVGRRRIENAQTPVPAHSRTFRYSITDKCMLYFASSDGADTSWSDA